jgi:formaldehyde-activating enzyme involved in methanogenesis
LFIDNVSGFRETPRTNSQCFADQLMGLFNGQTGFVAVIKLNIAVRELGLH